MAGAAAAQGVPAPPLIPPPLIPPPSREPVTASLDDDPVLAIGREAGDAGPLAAAARAAAARQPLAITGAAAGEAAAALAEARAVRSPSVDVTVTRYDVIDRNIQQPRNIIERSRPLARTDLLLSADQLLLDGGAASARIAAARQRLRAAEADVAGAQTNAALDTVAAWYDVFASRTLARLGDEFTRSQATLRAGISERVARGASATADLARVDSYAAAAASRAIGYRRRLAQAEARYEALTGTPAPASLGRAPAPIAPISRDLAKRRSAEMPAVVAARAAARAAGSDAVAARADRLPTLSAGIEAGRYGIYETPRDYDVRGRLTIRQRLFGGIGARVDGADARRAGAEARLALAEQEAARDAAIAWSDADLLAEGERSQAAAYAAARRTRDAVRERFRLSGGTLFDVLSAEDAFFAAAASYVQTVADLDAARWTLLSRTAALNPALGIAPAPRSYRP